MIVSNVSRRCGDSIGKTVTLGTEKDSTTKNKTRLLLSRNCRQIVTTRGRRGVPRRPPRTVQRNKTKTRVRLTRVAPIINVTTARSGPGGRAARSTAIVHEPATVSLGSMRGGR